MDALGALIEVAVAGDHPPLGVDAELAGQRHHLVEDLGDAAAAAGRIDVHHPRALERRGELFQAVDHHLPGDFGVGVEQAHEGAPPASSERKIATSRERSSAKVPK